MIILCKDCSHNNVCKHKYDYMKTVEKVKTAVDSPFNLQLNCPFYSKEKSNYYDSGITYNGNGGITLLNSVNDIAEDETIQNFVDTNTKKLDELIRFNNCDGIGVIDCNDTGFYKE